MKHVIINNIIHTADDSYEDNRFHVLTSEEEAFLESNPTATIAQVLNLSMDEPEMDVDDYRNNMKNLATSEYNSLMSELFNTTVLYSIISELVNLKSGISTLSTEDNLSEWINRYNAINTEYNRIISGMDDATTVSDIQQIYKSRNYNQNE